MFDTKHSDHGISQGSQLFYTSTLLVIPLPSSPVSLLGFPKAGVCVGGGGGGGGGLTSITSYMVDR